MSPDAAAGLPAGYTIRRRQSGDDEALVRVENAANRLLAAHGYPELAAHGIPDVAYLRTMIGGGDVFVAAAPEGSPAGYAVVQVSGRRLHLRELSVDPVHGRRGLGRALVSCVVAHACATGRSGVSLTTFRDVPFNAPFYAALGFRETADPELLAILLREVPEGVDLAERVAMALDF